MVKSILKWSFTLIGILIFLFCLVEEIDGVGRFACILFGTLFVILGSALSKK